MRQSGPRWIISFDDITAGLSNSSTIFLPTNPAGDVAEFFLEDPKSTGTVLPAGVVPMARVRTTVTGLDVNGQAPTSGQMTAQQFVDATGTTYFPTAFVNDSFALLHRRG